MEADVAPLFLVAIGDLKLVLLVTGVMVPKRVFFRDEIQSGDGGHVGLSHLGRSRSVDTHRFFILVSH